ncbi:hypothetical protein GVAV_001036 [Gurleya vavrai]
MVICSVPVDSLKDDEDVKHNKLKYKIKTEDLETFYLYSYNAKDPIGTSDIIQIKFAIDKLINHKSEIKNFLSISMEYIEDKNMLNHVFYREQNSLCLTEVFTKDEFKIIMNQNVNVELKKSISENPIIIDKAFQNFNYKLIIKKTPIDKIFDCYSEFENDTFQKHNPKPNQHLKNFEILGESENILTI